MSRKGRLAQIAARAWRNNWTLLVLSVVLAIITAAVEAAATTAMPADITAGLSALITLNAVVLALVYATTQRAVVLSLRGEVGRGFFEWSSYMSLMSIAGVMLGVTYLVWRPSGWLLGVAVALLVTAPGLVPVVAIQELLARRARSVHAVDRLLTQRAGSRRGEPLVQGDAGRLRVRAREFDADPHDPFASDVLNRRRIVEAVCRIVLEIDSPAVISVDGGWGSGKTAFGRMCVALLRSDPFQGQEGAVVEFNAWTQSYTGDPKQDLVSTLTRKIGGDSDLRERLLEVLEDQALRAATDGAIDPVLLATYDAGSEAARFKDLLAAFVASSQGRAVVFIDELDRCRPDHALRVLETARNLLDVPGVIVVVTVNLDALEHAVASLLGPQCDAETYLRRFIDLRVALPPLQDGDLHRFLGHLLEQTGLVVRLGTKDSYTRRILGSLAAVHPRSLRGLEQAVHRAVVLLASIEPAQDDYAVVASIREQTALTLLVLREADRAAYEAFVHGRIDGCGVGSALAKALPQGPLGSEMVDPESAQGSPTVPVMYVYRMEALLLATKRDGWLAAGQEDLEARYNGVGRPGDWPAIHTILGGIRRQIQGHELDLRELADLVELASFDSRVASASLPATA